MTSKYLALVLALFAAPAFAQNASFNQGHALFDSTGVNCTTGTAVEIVVSSPPYNTSGVRLQNQDSTYSIWVGYDSNVSTKTLNGDSRVKRGEKLVPGASGVWEVGWNYVTNARVKIFCIAADGAGTNTVPISVGTFAY